jgi:hypothetical protein
MQPNARLFAHTHGQLWKKRQLLLVLVLVQFCAYADRFQGENPINVQTLDVHLHRQNFERKIANLNSCFANNSAHPTLFMIDSC